MKRAEVFNNYLKYKLHQLNRNGLDVPYGINLGDYVYFSGAIGTNCYYKIADFIGGKFERIASGKSFDCYKYTELN